MLTLSIFLLLMLVTGVLWFAFGILSAAAGSPRAFQRGATGFILAVVALVALLVISANSSPETW